MDAIEVIQSLYGYNRWVNERLLDLVEQVPEARTRESFGGSFDTIQGTVAHVLQGEMHYYARCSGEPQPQRPADLPSIGEIRALWDEQDPKVQRFLGELGPDGPARTVRYTTRTGEVQEMPVWQIVLQMVNHGTHHRAELADMLTRVGLAPPATDYTVYCQEQARAHR